MATIERAIEIAARAHAGVRDKQGKPYLLHPLRVMIGVGDSESAQIVAVLHDVVEDTEMTFDDIREHGFDEELVEALALVTHRPEQSYADYVVACRANEIARQVKLADLRDNGSLDRLMMRADKLEKDTARMQKYVLSYRYLLDEMNESSYRQAMSTVDG